MNSKLFLWMTALAIMNFMTPISTKADEQTDAALRQLFHDYHEQFLILFPLEATSFGDSRYNDQLQIDIGEDFIAKKRQFFQSMKDRLAAIPNGRIGEELQLAAEILAYELDIRLSAIRFQSERIPFNQFEGLPLAMGQMGSGAGVHPFRSIKDYEDWLKRLESFAVWSKVAIERFREGIRMDMYYQKF